MPGISAENARNLLAKEYIDILLSSLINDKWNTVFKKSVVYIKFCPNSLGEFIQKKEYEIYARKKQYTSNIGL